MKMMRTIVGIICIVLFTACSDSREEAVYRLVKEWTGKEIKFPERSVFTAQGKDTVDFTYQDADYKVLVYVDSVGCTSCKLQLDRWKKVINEMTEETGKDIPFLFFLSSEGHEGVALSYPSGQFHLSRLFR